MAAPLTVSVVSADERVWSGEATQVVARTTEGQIGILADHEPVLAILADGEVKVTTVAGETLRVSADSGFLSVDSNVVQVVAGRASVIS